MESAINWVGNSLVSWDPRDESNAHNTLSPAIKVGVRHPTKKERKEGPQTLWTIVTQRVGHKQGR